ncbi:TonB-linked SusC/RagA family outer membrane protein [Pedobacter alluvionis]|nr:SusC/RagA family TonB-linked outer membrane protein [Pedobacter alluvionis]RLJ75143.1 TonB-linked SusC/RagA family outer membrane protein [Pedobacter alluvionis]
MRLHFILLLLLFTVIVALADDVKAQSITLEAKATPMYQVFKQIEKQTGYLFWYKGKMLGKNTPITASINNLQLKPALDKIFANIPFSYEIVDETIVVTEKLLPQKSKEKQNKQGITGVVNDENGQPLVGASVTIKGTTQTTMTDSEGKFAIDNVSDNSLLVISYVGYKSVEIKAQNNKSISVTLNLISGKLDDISVVSTGYQNIPKERATGSFVQIDNTLLNRRISTNILDRLDGITSGLIFNKVAGPVGIAPTNEKLGINIRGRVTIDSKVSADPLVVLDNFPYEGDINSINPNDIESITILKDAAAASIWGARSGNGVIVITTKKGKLNEALKIDLNTNITIGESPNLKYSRNFLNSSDYIDIEKYLYSQNYYNQDLANTTTYPVISPVVALLARNTAEANQQIDALRSIDVRDEASKHLYQKSLSQQYNLSLRGGSAKSTHLLSLGYDKNRYNNIGAGFDRLTINTSNTYRPIKNLEVSAAVVYNKSNQSSAYIYNPLYPYLKLADADGNPLSVPVGFNNTYLESAQALGYMDWKLRPLQERDLFDNVAKINNLLLRTSVRYQFLPFLSAEVQYQYQNENGNTRYLQSIDSYNVRNTINIYSQRNTTTGVFTYPVPKGGILSMTDRKLEAENFRTQLNYNQNFAGKHNISAITGAELRDIETTSYNRLSYGYNDDFGTAVTNLNYTTFFPLSPAGTGSRTVPAPDGTVNGTVNRFISYYANASYTFKDRYTATLSGRKDGANIFGANTNDKITPLWSAGLGYEISKEAFYNLPLIPYLKVRATYGYNGNVYNASSYLTATYSTSSLTGAQTATITSAPNPELRWEKIRNKNLGLDFATKKNRLNGTVEIYDKLGTDLIEDALLAPSTGFNSFKGNAASVNTKGVDIILNSINLNGDFKWYTNFLFSYNKDKVISYDTKYTTSYLTSNASNIADPARQGLYIKEGNSIFGVYSYKSAGLDPSSGDPVGYLNGIESKNYTAILSNNNPDDVIYHGSSRPTHFGALRNTFSYKGFSLSANVTYKFNYYIRKKSTSLNYTETILPVYANSDYALRWQKAGDENITTVPSMVFAVNTNRNTFYQNSEVLVEKGDHIRLQDIGLSYDLNQNLLRKMPFSSLQIYSYINNVGILWRANKNGIDPDVSDYRSGNYNVFPNPITYAFGVRANFK